LRQILQQLEHFTPVLEISARKFSDHKRMDQDSARLQRFGQRRHARAQ